MQALLPRFEERVTALWARSPFQAKLATLFYLRAERIITVGLVQTYVPTVTKVAKKLAMEVFEGLEYLPPEAQSELESALSGMEPHEAFLLMEQDRNLSVLAERILEESVKGEGILIHLASLSPIPVSPEELGRARSLFGAARSLTARTLLR